MFINVKGIVFVTEKGRQSLKMLEKAKELFQKVPKTVKEKISSFKNREKKENGKKFKEGFDKAVKGVTSWISGVFAAVKKLFAKKNPDKKPLRDSLKKVVSKVSTWMVAAFAAIKSIFKKKEPKVKRVRKREKTHREKTRSSAKRIIFRIGAGFLAVILFVTASGLLYVEGLFSSLDRSEIGGTMEAPESMLDIPSDIVIDTSEPEDGTDTGTESGVTSSTSSSTTSAEKKPTAAEKLAAGYKEAQNTAVLTDPNIYNILLIGTDGRGIGDATILVSINKTTGKIHLTSFMRAMYVNIPGHGWFMFNHAYAWGGPSLVMKTIENNFRVKVDDYMVINFDDFAKAVDIVGGIWITLTEKEAAELNNRTYGTTYTAGSQWLNGTAAFEYSRIRSIDSDFVRTERQRKVITALLEKCMVSSIWQLNELATQLLPLVKTSLTNAEILEHITNVVAYASYQIDQKMLPTENDTSGGKPSKYTGIAKVPYYNSNKIYVEVYLFDYQKNIKNLHSFIKS